MILRSEFAIPTESEQDIAAQHLEEPDPQCQWCGFQATNSFSPEDGVGLAYSFPTGSTRALI